MTRPRKRIGVLISGRGSNMAALIDASQKADYPAEIVLVMSNRADAAGLDLADVCGIPTAVIDHKAFSSRADFEASIDAKLRAADVDFVCLAGFMRILSAGFADAWKGRLVNIHPSLLPAFKGLNPQQQALDAGVQISGCSVHFVTSDLDGGPIVAQAAVPVQPKDTPATLSARILKAEHMLYPLALRMIAEGDVSLNGGRVHVRNGGTSNTLALFSPPLFQTDL
ncbi:MAG: phosphoribosylglycinamide formyltransferase [Pseudomonadota bacterium]